MPRSQVQLLTILTEIVSSGDDLRTMLDSTVRLVREVVQVERVSILLLDSRTARLQVGASAGIPEDVARSIHIELGQGIAGKVAESGEAELGNVGGATRGDDRYTTNSYISVPIRSDRKTIGVINITNKVNRQPLDANDVELMAAVARMLAVTIDRFHLHREVDELLDRLRRIFETIPVGILRLNAEGIVQGGNRNAGRLLRAPLDDGTSITAIPDRALGADLRRLGREAIETGGERATETRIGRGRDATPLRLRAVPVSTDETGESHALFVIEDMSLSREVEQLRLLDEMKDNFITLVSHELRTPITSIRGAASLLHSFYGPSLDEAPRNMLSIVSANVERLVQVVNSILDIALLDQRRLELGLGPTDLGTMIEQVVEAHARIIEDKQLTIEWLSPEDLPSVMADEARLRQALDAVVDNAIKFSRRGGHIRVEAEACNGTVKLAVEDSGPGIAPEYRELVFHKFYQIEDPMTRRQGGAGVGLYVAREILHLHRGRIHIEDPHHGPGARVQLEVPA